MSRAIYLIFGILAVIGCAVGIYFWTNRPEQIEKASVQAQRPAWGLIGWIQEKMGVAQQSLSTLEALEKEVQKLRVENTFLTTKMAQFSSLESENLRLQEALNFKQTTSFKLLACRVIARDLSTWSNTVIVDRGWEDDKDLAQDQPVVTPRGVVGKTGVVGRNQTKIILLSDPNCKIASEVEGTRAKGIVMGNSTMAAANYLCKITYVARETELAPHARVFTSGLGGVFPQGLLIGVVKDAPPLTSSRNFGLFREGTVEPIVDLDDLREVFIIVGEK